MGEHLTNPPQEGASERYPGRCFRTDVGIEIAFRVRLANRAGAFTPARTP
jgi:hypothetical protein